MKDHKKFFYAIDMPWDEVSLPNFCDQDAINQYNKMREEYVQYYGHLPSLDEVCNLEVHFSIQHEANWGDCGGLSCQARIEGWIPMTDKEIEAAKKKAEKDRLAAAKRKEKNAIITAKRNATMRANKIKEVKKMAAKDPTLLEELKKELGL